MASKEENPCEIKFPGECRLVIQVPVFGTVRSSPEEHMALSCVLENNAKLPRGHQ